MSDRRNWKVGLSCGRVSPEKLQKAAEAKLDCIEINGIEEGLNWEDVKKWESESGVFVNSLHLPFIWPKPGNVCCSPATLNPDEWEQTKSLCVPMIENAAGKGGVKIFVIHPSLEPNPEQGEKREALIESSIEHLSYISDVCKKYGAVLAVENLPRTCLGNTDAEMHRIIDANKDLKVCFDVNHLLKGDHVSFVKMLGDRIITTHISDYDFIDERHMFPRDARYLPKQNLATWGKINWGELQKALEDIDYNGAFMYEVSMIGHPDWIDVYANRQSLLDL